MRLEYQGNNCYKVPRENGMRVDAYIYLNNKLLPYLEDEAVRQLKDAAMLPGVYGSIIGMPDIHTGFGLPIGGIMATLESGGVISAGAVGMDINCGVRLVRSNLKRKDLDRRLLGALLREIEERVPAGVGKKSRHSGLKIRDILTQGAPFLVKEGYGVPYDIACCEENGILAGADPGKVSPKAHARAEQLSTLGGGNHFIEIVYVSGVFEDHTARRFGLEHDTIAVLIHTGSRGFGHQICTDYTAIMYKAAGEYGITLPSKGLAAVPVDSSEGRDYYAAMACAVNFAFANRQLITYDVREAFCKALGSTPEELGLNLVYDVCHNIAKFEEHEGKKILVHRKGAVRALPAGDSRLHGPYTDTGNPVLVPGSMGSPSYVVVAADMINKTYYSLNHGAGRTISRTAARKIISLGELKKDMRDILVNVNDLNRILDEAPAAYKNVKEVIDTLTEAGLSRKVAQLQSLAVIKGED